MAGASSPRASPACATPSSSETPGSMVSRRRPRVSRSSPIARARGRWRAGRSRRSRIWTTSPRFLPCCALASTAASVELLPEPASASGPAPAGPLADRMRPRMLDDVVGQEHLLGPGRVLRAALERGELHSMILWGPPGSGKTTLASLMAQVTGARFVAFSAVLSGVKEIRQVVGEAETERARRRRRTILFVDEIHRFNRAQQDAFLPHVEKGTIVLIGA